MFRPSAYCRRTLNTIPPLWAGGRLRRHEPCARDPVTHDVDESVQLADRVGVLTARPGRIADVVPVDLPHPRDLGSPEYGRTKNREYELLAVRHPVGQVAR